MQPTDQKNDADVIVVGAGPSGSAAAYWLATAGVDVLLLEKTSFPREKVCGDGLTPRGTRALVDMGIDVSEEAGWLHNKGLRVIGGGMRLELDWPELASLPELRPGPARGPTWTICWSSRRSRPAPGCTSRPASPARSQDARAGWSASTRQGGRPGRRRTEPGPTARRSCWPATGCPAGSRSRSGLQRNDKRPMGVAVRRYYTSPRTHDDYLESWLELWDGPPGADDAKLLPGYGWIFGMGDGTVNVGLGRAEHQRPASRRPTTAPC